MEISQQLTDLVQYADQHQDLVDYARRNRQLFKQLVQATDFLSPKARARQRLWHVKNLTEQPGKCAMCQSPTKWHDLDRQYNKYCCVKCAHSDPEVRAKTAKTNLERYGHTSSAMGSDVIAKRNKTLVSKYGTTNRGVIASDPTVVQKRADTNLRKYGDTHNWGKDSSVRYKSSETHLAEHGVPYPIQHSETAAKIAQTNLTRYGTTTPITAPQTVAKKVATNLERYGHANPRSSDAVKAKIASTMLERYGPDRAEITDKTKQVWLDKYGVDHPWKLAEIHQKTIDSKGDYYYLPDEIIQKLTSADWFNNQVAELQKTYMLIASELNVSPNTVSWYAAKLGIKSPHRFTSQLERNLVQDIQNMYRGTVLTSARDVIPPKELDIYLPDASIAIEINGTFWHGEMHGKSQSYHLDKTIACADKAIELYHFSDNDITFNYDIVTNIIRSALGLNQCIDAKTLNLVCLSDQQQSAFFDKHHLEGSAPASVAYGLTTADGEVVIATAFAETGHGMQYQIIRIASAFNVTVVGGTSRLFNYFCCNNTPASMIAYSDNQFESGDAYRDLGFTFTRLTPPEYRYFKRNNSSTTHSRHDFQLSLLKDKVDTFDPELSEWENMQANGYDRIWDCGYSEWVWTAQ